MLRGCCRDVLVLVHHVGRERPFTAAPVARARLLRTFYNRRGVAAPGASRRSLNGRRWLALAGRPKHRGELGVPAGDVLTGTERRGSDAEISA